MTIQKVKDAINLLDSFEKTFSSGPQPELLIRQAETLLGVVFPDDYFEFLRTVGALSFGAQEIYGITGPDLETGPIPNGIWATLQNRKDGLPDWLLVLGHSEFGAPCLDIRDPSNVVAYFVGYPETAQTYEVLAPNFGDYFLKLVNDEIEFLG